MKLPRYTRKDYLVLFWVILPFTIVLNTLIFGKLYYSTWYTFALGTALSGIAFSFDFVLCGLVAVALKSRLPKENQLPLRLTLMILTFLIITGLFLFSLIKGYEAINLFGYTFNEARFIWSYIAMGIFNIFLTFLIEGISRFEEWKANQKETEQVKISYRQTQLSGLKSHINPHFLFNCLNTLSSLISENEETAEKFLDEMSKIYRYMLRNDDEQLVPLATEINFIKSYFYLLNTRYSTSMQLSVSVRFCERQKLIPPLTLQYIVEDTIAQNSFSKSAPLKISIKDANGFLEIRNSVQTKIGIDKSLCGLRSIVEKYRLLHETDFLLKEENGERLIQIPLIVKNEPVAV
ncbi:MAG: histidine kinase [Chitinophagaceae bacterium]|nr:histidine kinase [Chitinophagaceae bacterium]